MQQSPSLSLPLLLFHGLLSSPQEFGLITHWLRNNGVVHEAVTVPGYTLATDVRSPDWRRWREAALDVVEASGEPGSPVILGGLCMGGVLAAAAALQTRRRLAGLVLMSPTFVYDGWGLPFSRHLRKLGYLTRLDRFFAVKEREPFGVKSPKIRKWIVRQLTEQATSAAGPARVPLTALREGERMMAEVRGHLGELDCPILILHAREDEITSLAAVQTLFDGLPQRDKTLAVLDNSYHMITIDNDRHEVAALLKHFVQRVSGQVAGSTVVSPSSSAAVSPAATPALT